MSGIFGIFNRNGNPAEEKTVHTMLDTMSYREPNDRGVWIDGPVALGHTMLWNMPESKLEHLPNEQDHHVITIDARLDNREELIEKLDLSDRPLEQVTDSNFILAAYKKWGEECPKYLLGDFAFAIWDEKNQQIFCARDHIGIKPFYYHLDDEKFIFANNIRGIISHPQISKTFDDRAIAIYLIEGQLIDPDLTFFESVRQLRPATSLIVSAENIKKNTYWRIEESPPVHFDSIEEYSDKLRELLEDAVRVRIRSDYPIASHLSGGLDSSVIAVLAARFLRSEEKPLHTYNWIPFLENGDDPDYWEWKNSKKIADKEQINHYHLNMNAHNITDIYESLDISSNDTITFWYEHLVQKAAKKHNVRVMLSGWGGDDLISHNGYSHVASLFWSGKLKHAFSVLYAESSNAKYPWLSLLRKFYRQIVLLVIPEQFSCLIGKDCDAQNPLQYLKSDFIKSFKEFKRNGKFLNKIGVHKYQLNAYNYGHIQTRIDSWNASGFSNGIEYRYPLLDKRVVEFSVGIPAELYRQNGINRFLFRYATKGIIPDKIRLSNTKYEPKRVNLFYHLLFHAQKHYMEDMRINSGNISSRYIDVDSLLKDIEMFNINNTIISEKEIEKLEIFEKSILLLGLGTVIQV